MPSTVIANIEYLPVENRLRISFVSGKTYDYLHVPPAIFQALRSSSSKGIYFNRYIKTCYAFEQVQIEPGNSPGEDSKEP